MLPRLLAKTLPPDALLWGRALPDSQPLRRKQLWYRTWKSVWLAMVGTAKVLDVKP